jgi:dipeptidyl aminopeptidase/acylaminoacyl peptidase
MNHVLASGKSYIVLEIDGAGTGGQGEANKMLVKYNLGQVEVQDQLDAIK